MPLSVEEIGAGASKLVKNLKTEALKKILSTGNSSAIYREAAMMLAREGADVTAQATSGDQNNLLHVLVLNNKSIANNHDIEELVELNPAVLESKNNDNRTPLQALINAFQSGNCSFKDFKQSAMTLARLKANTTVRSSIGDQPTLLHLLVLTNKDGANNNDIDELVELNRAVLESEDYFDRTPLQSLINAFQTQDCFFEDFKQSAMTLARQKANTTLRSSRGNSPTLLHVLALNNQDGVNNKEIIELITLNAAVLESTDYYKRTPLQALIESLRTGEISFQDFKPSAMFLAQQGARLSLPKESSSYNTFLHVLVLNDFDKNDDEIAALIALDKDVLNYTDYKGCTPIHSLLSRYYPNVTVDAFEKLLSKENLQAKDTQGATLPHAACLSGNQPALEYLLFKDKGRSLSALTNNGQTLIHYAVSSRNASLIQFLIDTKKIDINAKDKFGETALHYAAKHNYREVAELLTLNGADSTITNKKNQRPAQMAVSSGYPNLAAYLTNPKDILFEKIRAMHDYGDSLRKKSVTKGQVVINLADKLKDAAKQFFNQAPEQRDFAEFEPKFLKLLHSKDPDMSTYRTSWVKIVANIAIALTGIGLLAIAAKLVHSELTKQRALFFFQKSTTTSENKVSEIEAATNKLSQSLKPD